MKPVLAKVAKGLLEGTSSQQVSIQSQQKDSEDIIFCMANTGQFVGIGQHKRIECTDAVLKTKNLDWTFRKNGISFINNKTGDNLFFCRVDSDKWYADTPIRLANTEGLFWASFVDESTMEKMITLFFAEADWFSATHWHESPDPFEDMTPYGVYQNEG